MTTRPCTIFIFTSLLNAWKLSKGAVETLTCSSSSSIQIGSTTTTFQFGDGKTPYNTLLSCTWTFKASDPSARLVIGQRLKCGDGDELSLRDGGGGPTTISCCVDCTKTPKVTGPTATIGFTSDGTRNPDDIGFYLDVFAGKDEPGCTSQNNTFNISISSPYIITSPNFPLLYPNQIECRYTFIPVPISQGLVISFQFINLDYDRDCYDKIILKEGDMNGNTIAEICKDYGRNNPVLSPNETYRTTGSLFLHFISDSDYAAHGFRAIVQHDSTSGNTESTTLVTTDSTITKSTTQSKTTELITVSTTTSEATTSRSIISPNPTITENTTLPTTSESTTTEIITPTTSTPTSQENISSKHNTEEDNEMYVYIGSSVAVITVIFFVSALVMTRFLRRKNASRYNYEISPVQMDTVIRKSEILDN
ncbi:neuropilin-1-like isoform X2 [Saccostrea echinata]|uniref:neuropilin-1-like isoform X2 n=1 Tax=Saccostrea echinata TaxID=191078 RepID=UPI002A83273D|nr:neuropilin-1-like isoform X2 [Saccostrea echinata]